MKKPRRKNDTTEKGEDSKSIESEGHKVIFNQEMNEIGESKKMRSSKETNKSTKEDAVPLKSCLKKTQGNYQTQIKEAKGKELLATKIPDRGLSDFLWEDLKRDIWKEEEKVKSHIRYLQKVMAEKEQEDQNVYRTN